MSEHYGLLTWVQCIGLVVAALCSAAAVCLVASELNRCVNDATERERKERCRDAAERFELASDFPAGFRVGSLANPWPAYEGPAYFALVNDLAPTEAARR